MSDADFARFQRLVYDRAGIHLTQTKKNLLLGRLGKRLRELRLASMSEYYTRLTETEDAREECVRLLDAVTTNETSFFREPQHFEFLEQRVYPAWLAGQLPTCVPRRVRAWSAGCSTGEEPFSLAMSLLAHFPPEVGWEVEIIATDLSTRVLTKAQEALWPVEQAKEIPRNYLKAFMLRGVDTNEGRMKASALLRDRVRFQRLNLYTDLAPTGSFDLVFCRNVLIYFDRASKQRVLDKLIDRLAPSGLLFLGHAESLTGMAHRLQVLVPTVYSYHGRQALSLAASPRQRLATPRGRHET